MNQFLSFAASHPILAFFFAYFAAWAAVHIVRAIMRIG